MGKYIEPAEVRKVCKENNLDEQIMKAKKKTADVKKLINDNLTGGKKVSKDNVELYIKELELDTVCKECKDKDLDKEILKCTDDSEKATKIVNDVLSSKGIEVSQNTVTEYIRELEIKEIRKICEEKGLDKQIIKCSDNFNKAKEIIDAELSPKDIKVTMDSVKEYTEELLLEEVHKVCKENDLNKEVKKHLDNVEEAKKIIDAALPKEIKVSTDVVKKYIEELKINNVEITEEEITVEKKGCFITVEELKERDFLRKEKDKLEKDTAKLKEENESLKQRLKENSERIDIRNPFSQIPDLNEILNSNEERTTVTINKDLLSKATKIVVSRSLIRLENIVRFGNDLNSSIVQSIILAFIQDNSLQ